MGHTLTPFLPAVLPHRSTFLHCSLRPSQNPCLQGKGGGGAFLHRAGPCKAGAAQASVVPLGPPNPGVRKTASRVHTSSTLLWAAAPVGSGLGPRERTLGEAHHPVCLCESVCCRLAEEVLSPQPPRLTPGEDAAQQAQVCAGMANTYRLATPQMSH